MTALVTKEKKVSNMYLRQWSHGAFRYDAEKSDWNLKKIIKGCYILLYVRPAQQDDYQSVTGSEKFSL